MTRERGPLDSSFEAGYVPMDCPPGIEEREYTAWKAAGGRVHSEALELNKRLERHPQATPSFAQLLPGVMPDWMIRELNMIEGFQPAEERPGKISYGVTSYGYDVRLGRNFKVFTNVYGAVMDPKNVNPKSFVDFLDVDSIIIPPNSYALGKSIERFNVPPDVLCLCIGKSTYARCGIIVNVTPLEPAWQGKITIEISNSTPIPAKIYAEEGIMQVVFIRGILPCERNYEHKKGKYQNQEELTTAIVQPKLRCEKCDGMGVVNVQGEDADLCEECGGTGIPKEHLR